MEYQLTAGTRLADRYRIEGVIGYGGFSITYQGMDEHVQTKVAIKELYVPEYMGRDVEKTSEIFLLHEEDRESFEKARENFLKEAIIVGIFNSDAGVVSVLDHFRENNTAYIVMEYLDGVSLLQYLKRRGSMEAEEVFQRMLPLISTLQKIHDNEVIHRDISPDNIMVMPDGTFKLIDFGAARSYASEMKLSHIVKEGYAPPEQWSKDGHQGPWTDVYALCATIYECITGITPESSIQRMFLDEVKKPSDLNVAIDKELEKILWKGMAVVPEERYQNLKEMEREIRKVLPEPVFKQPIGKGIKAAVLFCGLVIIGLGTITGFVVYRDYREAHKFAGMQTQVTAIYPEDGITAQEYYKARELLEERIQVFAGDLPYQIDEKKNGELLITLPQEIFGKEKAEKVYQDLLLGKWENKIGGWIEEIGANVLCSIEQKDIVSANICEGSIPIKLDEEKIPQSELKVLEDAEYYIEIVLTDEKIQEIQEKIPQRCRTSLWNYYEEFLLGGYWCPVYLNETMDRLYLCNNYVNESSLANVLIYDLTHESFECDVSYTCSLNAEWEKVENNMLRGKYQCNEEEIPDPAITTVYGARWDEDNIQRGEWLYTLINMKERLDALRIPYAIGVDQDNEQHILVKTEQCNASSFVLETLLDYNSGIQVGSLWKTANFSLSYNEIGLKFEKNGSEERLVLTESEDSYSDYIKEYTEQVWNQGITQLYLKAGRYLLAECLLTGPVTNHRLVFNVVLAKHRTPFAGDGQRMVDYVTVCTKQANMALFGLGYGMLGVVCTDADGKLTAVSTLEQDLSMLNDGEAVEKEIRALYPGCRISGPDTWEDASVDVYIDLESEKNWQEELIEAVKQIYNLEEIKKGWIESVSLCFTKKAGTKKENIAVYLYKRSDKKVYEVFSVSSLSDEKKEIEEKIRKDSFFSGKLNERFGEA